MIAKGKITINALVMCAALVLAACDRAPSGMSEAQIKTVITEIDHAGIKQDAAVYEKYLAPEAKIIITRTTDKGPQMLLLTKEQYMQSLRQGWESSKDYKVVRNVTQITFAEGGRRATVRSHVEESVTVRDRIITSKADDVTQLMLTEGGAIQIIEVAVAHAN